MYAIIRTGGKQHRVSAGEKLRVDRLVGEVGSEFTINDVLFVGGEGDPKIGMPTVEGASVTAKIVDQDRDKKILVFKKLRRKGFHKTIGHRQDFTEIEIIGITG